MDPLQLHRGTDATRALTTFVVGEPIYCIDTKKMWVGDGSTVGGLPVTDLPGGNGTTLLGSIPYQSAANVTSLLSPNVTTTTKYLSQVGNGTNGAAPAWNTIALAGLSDWPVAVSATEVGYLDGVTSAIQTQLNAKAPIASPTFTGTVSGITATMVGLGNVTNNAQTQSSIVPNTAPSAGQVLVGNAGGTAYAPVSISSDATLVSTGAITVTKSTNIKGGNNTTLFGSIPYQSNTDTTTLLSPNTTTTKKFFRQTGDGTNGAAPAWDTLVASDLPTIGNITNLGAIGAVANLPLITTTSGVVTVGSFGTVANTFCVGDDSRLSDARTPLSHTTGSHSDWPSSVSMTEVGYLDGATSAIQTQINGKQNADATLTALAGLATGADKLPYSTGVDTFSQADFPAFGRSLLAATSNTVARTTLGVGEDMWRKISNLDTFTLTSGSWYTIGEITVGAEAYLDVTIWINSTSGGRRSYHIIGEIGSLSTTQDIVMLNRGAIGSFSSIRVANTATTTRKLLQVRLATGITTGPALLLFYKYLPGAGTAVSIAPANYVDDTASVTTILGEPRIDGTYIANPMTTANDILIGGVGGIPTRFAIGAARTSFMVNSAGTAYEWKDDNCKAVTASTTGTIASTTGLEEFTGTGDITRTLPAANSRGSGNCYKITVKNLKSSGTATLSRGGSDSLYGFGGTTNVTSVGVATGQSIIIESNGVDKWFIVS